MTGEMAGPAGVVVKGAGPGEVELGEMTLVKRLAQRVNEQSGCGLPIKGKKCLRIEAEGIFQRLFREVKLTVQVDFSEEVLTNTLRFDLGALFAVE